MQHLFSTNHSPASCASQQVRAVQFVANPPQQNYKNSCDGACDCNRAVWHADPAMKQQLCWEQLPVHVLELIFDKQVNALDNCGAAATCKAWRDVVHSSKINEMHLNATSASAASHWAVFLRARPAIHHLRLTSVFDQLKPEHSS